MVQSIGIDLVEIKRIEKTISKHGNRFAGRILGADELSAFNARHDKAAYLAGRFAAKEAIIKSLGKFLNRRPTYASLQILNDKSGHPFLSGKKELSKVFKNRNCLISISHERHYATAIAMITDKQ
jgi:holo-[acyl-carrier protein] synthase